VVGAARDASRAVLGMPVADRVRVTEGLLIACRPYAVANGDRAPFTPLVAFIGAHDSAVDVVQAFQTDLLGWSKLALLSAAADEPQAMAAEAAAVEFAQQPLNVLSRIHRLQRKQFTDARKAACAALSAPADLWRARPADVVKHMVGVQSDWSAAHNFATALALAPDGYQFVGTVLAVCDWLLQSVTKQQGSEHTGYRAHVLVSQMQKTAITRAASARCWTTRSCAAGRRWARARPLPSPGSFRHRRASLGKAARLAGR
jgi:hypothetical protein